MNNPILDSDEIDIYLSHLRRVAKQEKEVYDLRCRIEDRLHYLIEQHHEIHGYKYHTELYIGDIEIDSDGNISYDSNWNIIRFVIDDLRDCDATIAGWKTAIEKEKQRKEHRRQLLAERRNKAAK